MKGQCKILYQIYSHLFPQNEIMDLISDNGNFELEAWLALKKIMSSYLANHKHPRKLF